MTGQQIKAIRKAAGLTQTEFARVMVVSFATVNRWEKGHCKPLQDRLVRLRQLKAKWKDGRVRFMAHAPKA